MGRECSGRISAAKAIAASFGIIGGLGGAVHGIGEVLQGPVKPGGVFIPSWTEGPIALYFDGDPAMTLAPDLLFAGILTLLLSALIIVWSGGFLKSGRGGSVLILLSVALLLAGGGVGPPALVLLAGVAGLGVNARYLWWEKRMKGVFRHNMALIWPYLFAVGLGSALFNLVGHLVAAYFFAPADAEPFLYSFLLAVFMLPATIVAGIAYDLNALDLADADAAD